MRVRLESIGCRLNIGEIEAMARGLSAAGHRVVGPGEAAELYILNTCSVTSIASKKSRQLVRQLKRANPAAALVVTGCDSELTPREMESIGVDLIVGNADKDRLLGLAAEQGLLREPEPDLEADSVFGPGASSRTRAFLKVQDGCDNRCTFCVTTIARGAGRSVPLEEILEEVAEVLRLGHQEIVLSGVHLGSYGHDFGDRRGLHLLVERILAETEAPRLRLSSLEPWDLDAGFFDLFANPRLLPHIHLPLQSGCDTTLERMARRTCRRDFSDLLGHARRAVPDLAVSTDVIVGFPGESDDEFEESISFIEEMKFSRLHVFRYSKREGTVAAGMPDQVRGPIARERSRRMHELGAALEQKYSSRFVGRTVDVLWETAEDHDNSLKWSGLTPHYIRVCTTTPPDGDLLNTVTPTEITDVVPGGVAGRIRNSEF